MTKTCSSRERSAIPRLPWCRTHRVRAYSALAWVFLRQREHVNCRACMAVTIIVWALAAVMLTRIVSGARDMDARVDAAAVRRVGEQACQAALQRGLALEVCEPGIVVEQLAGLVVLPDFHHRAPYPLCGRQGDRTRDTVGEKPTATGWPLVPLPRLAGCQALQVRHPGVDLAVRVGLTHQHVVQMLLAQLHDEGLVAVE